mmetsp:Transcript_27802/g.68551  ORF Transcript_27802/g.68551 Transcript_27802/m.68551 type:complete len:222 (-) Transcript_27802:623-1288(-)
MASAVSLRSPIASASRRSALGPPPAATARCSTSCPLAQSPTCSSAAPRRSSSAASARPRRSACLSECAASSLRPRRNVSRQRCAHTLWSRLLSTHASESASSASVEDESAAHALPTASQVEADGRSLHARSAASRERVHMACCTGPGGEASAERAVSCEVRSSSSASRESGERERAETYDSRADADCPAQKSAWPSSVRRSARSGASTTSCSNSTTASSCL